MGTVKESEAKKTEIGVKRSRYLTRSENLMMVVIDFNDGPTGEPDPPHHHPHEQISYVAAGEIIVILGEERLKLGAGDMFVVPPHLPHCVQLLTSHVRLVDAFTPVREDFLPD